MSSARCSIPAVTAFVAFVLMALLYLPAPAIYAAVLYRWGAPAWDFPFLDFQNSLAAWECARRGLDVTLVNPCDAGGRVYNYGPGWISLSFVPLGTGDLWWTGLLVDFVFLVSLFFLPPVTRRWEIAAMTVACLSPPVAFVLERANIDAIVFALVVAAGHLALRGPAAAYAVIVVAAMLKYYPVTMLVLALRERLTAFVAIVGASVAALGLYAVVYSQQIRQGIAAIPDGFYFTGFISAQNLPMGSERVWHVPAAVVMAVLLMGFLLGIMAILRSRALIGIDGLPEKHRIFAVLGCALLVGCFFIGQSVSYRLIMFLFVLPGLLIMARESMLARIAFGAILILMWESFFRFLLGIPLGPRLMAAPIPHWIVRELVWWFVVAVLFAMLAEFAGKARALSRAA